MEHLWFIHRLHCPGCLLSSTTGIISCNHLGNGGDYRSTIRATNSLGYTEATIRTISGHNDDTFCAIASDNNAYCWGHGGDGQLGNSTWVNSKVAVAVDKASGVLSGLTIKSISAGYRHTCALSSNNTIACWGRGGNGQLGDGGTSASPTPLNTVMYGVLSGKTVTNIVTGWYQSCAKTTENKFYCWGWNDSAQLGVGNFTQYELPVLSVPGFTF